MADDNDKPSAQPARANRGRRRPPATIDLKATEVAAADPPAAAVPPPPEPEPAAPETPKPQAVSEPPPPPPPPPRSTLWPMLGATTGGAVIAVAIVLLMWGTPARRDDIRQQDARIAALDTTVRQLAARETPPAADPKAVASLAERVAKVEAAAVAPQPAPDPALANRLGAIEQRIGALTDEFAALKRRSEAIAAAAEAAQRRADAAAARAENAQAAGAQQQAALAKQRETRADESAVRLALIAEMLKAAVARGDRFRTELDAAKALAPDQAALAPLEAFADTGVPTAAALGQQLRALLPAMRRAVEPKGTAAAGFLQRLQANAERLVRIQPIGERPGDDAAAILARIEGKLGRGDIAGALAEVMALPPNFRAPAEEWIKRAQMRDAAFEASQRFAAAHVGALAGRSD